MAQWKTLGSAAVGLTALFALQETPSAQYVVDNSKIPGDVSRSENVDFGDVDLDGDWDAAIADGGDAGNDQNRLWINQGGAQGGTLGVFLDLTSTQFPVVIDDSRDIEFADIDMDADLDIYTSNTAQLDVTQGNRWFVNQGGIQGGTIGFYVDDTANRWVGLGVFPSSVPPNLLTSGTFKDWSCDCDFGDLDNDGDLDLVHSTYGGAFGGQVPTRLFLNDGAGHFSEFNPSGFMIPVDTISPGNPGLWCDGTQQTNTTNSTGAFCDIATSTLDIDVGDSDGDFDLDILHGDREQNPRFFANRLDGSGLAPAVGGGALGFRDVTGMVYPGGYSSGNGHYEQEWGDLDKDGDLDIYGLNWQVSLFSFNDITMVNNGSGIFSGTTVLSGSGSDDNEGDFVDYDNDGDLDLYVANFSGQDRLYRNNYAGAGFSFTQVSLPSFGATSLDADMADTDGDGDYDVIVSEDGPAANTFLRNVTEIPDTHAPYIPNVEQAADVTASTTPTVVRAHVYDNAPYYITWYNKTVTEVTVGGVDIPDIKSVSSAGQVFRTAIPGNLVGSIDYKFTSSDEYGNTGSSATLNYTGSSGLTYAVPYGTGSVGVGAGTEPTLSALSVPFGSSLLYLAGHSDAAPATNGFIAIASAKQDPAVLIPGTILANITGTFFATIPVTTDANGDAVVAVKVPAVAPGTKAFAQAGFFDATASGEALSGSKGLEITTQ